VTGQYLPDTPAYIVQSKHFVIVPYHWKDKHFRSLKQIRFFLWRNY